MTVSAAVVRYYTSDVAPSTTLQPLYMRFAVLLDLAVTQGKLPVFEEAELWHDVVNDGRFDWDEDREALDVKLPDKECIRLEDLEQEHYPDDASAEVVMTKKPAFYPGRPEMRGYITHEDRLGRIRAAGTTWNASRRAGDRRTGHPRGELEGCL